MPSHRPGSPGRSFPARILAWFAGISVAIACSNYGEGERCSTLNGNDDCQGGLVCTSASTLGYSTDVCCPADRTRATTQVCSLAAAPVGGDAGIPVTPEASVGSEPTPEAGPAAPAVDAAEAASPDAPASDAGASDAMGD